MNRLLPIIAFILMTAIACSTSPTPDPLSTSPATDLNRSAPTSGEPKKIRHSMDDSNVVEMWTNAEAARQQGAFEQAGVYIESALRITPDDPMLWSRLAELRMRLGEYPLAENYAAKSNALGADNTPLLHRNWLIIQHSRDERGDVLGAREAQLEVRKYAAE